ncbi:hypothetical protein AAE478_002564 [Parahypoxylon ruwenzoriense]
MSRNLPAAENPYDTPTLPTTKEKPDQDGFSSGTPTEADFPSKYYLDKAPVSTISERWTGLEPTEFYMDASGHAWPFPRVEETPPLEAVTQVQARAITVPLQLRIIPFSEDGIYIPRSPQRTALTQWVSMPTILERRWKRLIDDNLEQIGYAMDNDNSTITTDTVASPEKQDRSPQHEPEQAKWSGAGKIWDYLDSLEDLGDELEEEEYALWASRHSVLPSSEEGNAAGEYPRQGKDVYVPKVGDPGITNQPDFDLAHEIRKLSENLPGVPRGHREEVARRLLLEEKKIMQKQAQEKKREQAQDEKSGENENESGSKKTGTDTSQEGVPINGAVPHYISSLQDLPVQSYQSHYPVGPTVPNPATQGHGMAAPQVHSPSAFSFMDNSSSVIDLSALSSTTQENSLVYQISPTTQAHSAPANYRLGRRSELVDTRNWKPYESRGGNGANTSGGYHPYTRPLGPAHSSPVGSLGPHRNPPSAHLVPFALGTTNTSAAAAVALQAPCSHGSQNENEKSTCSRKRARPAEDEDTADAKNSGKRVIQRPVVKRRRGASA